MVGKEEPCVYQTPDAPVEARVQDLLSRMTLPEKIGQMTQIERTVASPAAIRDFFIGTHTNHTSSYLFLSEILLACPFSCRLWQISFVRFSSFFILRLTIISNIYFVLKIQAVY